MNDLFGGIAGYPLSVIYSAITAVVITSAVKPFIRKKLQNITDAKEYADKLSDACFYLNLALCALFYGGMILLTGTPFKLSEALGFTLASLSVAEIIYSAYEKVGLKTLVKRLMELLSDKDE